MDEAALIRQLKQKVEDELRQRELALLEFWLQELKNYRRQAPQGTGGSANGPEKFPQPGGDPGAHPQDGQVIGFEFRMNH